MRDTFKAMSEALIDARLALMESVSMNKGEHVIEHLGRVIWLLCELENKKYPASETERSHVLLHGILSDFRRNVLGSHECESHS